jgi:hypothetical protein
LLTGLVLICIGGLETVIPRAMIGTKYENRI